MQHSVIHRTTYYNLSLIGENLSIVGGSLVVLSVGSFTYLKTDLYRT